MSPRRHLFVSDLHLDASAPEAVAAFRRFLREEARDSDALYILGDLFETWVGDDDDEPVRGAVCADLREFTRSGVPCFVLRGNRDFLLGRDFESHTGCTLLPDPVLLQTGAVRAVISHGDQLCSADRSYLKFRSLASARWFRASMLGLPLATRRALAGFARARSREHTRQLRTEIMDVAPEAAAGALRCGDSNLLIHGHTHRPGIHALEVDGRPATRIVLGDWYDQGSCLVLDADGSHQLIALPHAVAAARPLLQGNA